MARTIRATKQIAAGLILSLAVTSITRISHAQLAPAPGSTTTPSEPITITTSTNTVPSPSPPTNLAPSAFLGVASATGDGFIFYQGGQLNTAVLQNSNELVALDVSKSWPISSPAWTTLASLGGIGGPKVSYHSATMSKDLSTMYLTAPTGIAKDPFLYQYNVKTGTWASDIAPAAQAAMWSNRTEAQFLTDPLTGTIWYLGGALPGDILTNEIDRYLGGFWNTNIPTTDGIGPTSITTMDRFSSGTSHLLKTKIYLFGGFMSRGNGPKSYRNFQNIPWIDISTSTPTIGTMLTLGVSPLPRQDHCSVLTSSLKVIIFGGYDANTKQTFSDLWVLDLVTATWQQVIPYNPPEPRYGHNCNIVGANMVVYGGRSSIGSDGISREIGYSKDVQVYDVMQASWMSSYSPKQDTTPISDPLPNSNRTGAGSGQGNDSSLTQGALIGILFSVVAVICIIIGVLIYRRRQKRIETREAELEKATYMTTLGSEGGGEHGEHGENKHRASRSSSRGHRRQHSRDRFKDRRSHYTASATSPRSGSTRPLNGATNSAANTPGMSYYGLSGIESTNNDNHNMDQDPTYTAPPGQSGVQYLMQQLPDGTIAVQPVYLDHQPLPLQHSPNMVYTETSSLGGLLGTPMGSPAATSTLGAPYIAPPPPLHNNGSADEITVIPAPPEPTRGRSHRQNVN